MLAFINLFCMLLLQLQIYFIIIKDNVMSLCSNTMPWKYVGGMRVKIHAFVTVLLDGSE